MSDIGANIYDGEVKEGKILNTRGCDKESRV